MKLWPFGKKMVEERQYNYSVLLQHLYRANIAQAGVPVNEDTALRLMAVWACVRVITEDISSLPLAVYRRIEDGKEIAPEHPLYSILHDAPNPEMSAMVFRETMTAHLLTYGNAFAQIEDDGMGRVRHLWPLHPSSVSLRRNTASNELEYYVQPSYGETKRIQTNRMFHIWGLSANGIQGLSPIGYARETIGMGLAAEQFGAGFFAHGLRPSAYFMHPGQLSEAAHQRLRADLEGSLAGVSNAQRTAILEEGMSVKESMVSPEDAQFLESRGFTVLEIARLYRVQPHKIAVTQGSMSYSSVEQANIDHVVSTVRPWAVRWEQAIQQQLMPPEERAQFFVEHKLDGLLRGDAASRANFYRTLWSLGALSPNDIRRLENMNPITDGDSYYVPLNTAPVPVQVREVDPAASDAIDAVVEFLEGR